jgi:hypothetical protein
MEASCGVARELDEPENQEVERQEAERAKSMGMSA